MLSIQFVDKLNYLITSHSNLYMLFPNGFYSKFPKNLNPLLIIDGLNRAIVFMAFLYGVRFLYRFLRKKIDDIGLAWYFSREDLLPSINNKTLIDNMGYDERRYVTHTRKWTVRAFLFSIIAICDLISPSQDLFTSSTLTWQQAAHNNALVFSIIMLIVSLTILISRFYVYRNRYAFRLYVAHHKHARAHGFRTTVLYKYMGEMTTKFDAREDAGPSGCNNPYRFYYSSQAAGKDIYNDAPAVSFVLFILLPIFIMKFGLKPFKTEEKRKKFDAFVIKIVADIHEITYLFETLLPFNMHITTYKYERMAFQRVKEFKKTEEIKSN